MKKVVKKSLRCLVLEALNILPVVCPKPEAATRIARYLGGHYVKTKMGWVKTANQASRIAATRAVSLSAYDAKRLADGCSCSKCQTLRAKELAHVRA